MEFSPYGFCVIADNLITNILLSKTSMGLSVNQFRKNTEIIEHQSMLLFSIEEALIYEQRISIVKPYFGVGIGYYLGGMSKNGMEVDIGDNSVVNEDLNFNFGFHFLLGVKLPGNNLFVQFKYIFLPTDLKQVIFESYTSSTYNKNKHLLINFPVLSIGLIF